MTAGPADFYSMTVLGSSLYAVLWLFLVYSFIGVIVEMLFCLLVEGVLESRTGLLYLPLRPIYGLGGVAYALACNVTREPVALFVYGFVVGSVIEYGAAFMVEKAFGTVSWDYSDKRCNLHGRICLQYSLCWGFLALLVGYVLDPLLSRLVDEPDRQLGEAVLTVLLLLSLLAGLVTAAALIRMRRAVAVLLARGTGEPSTVGTTAWDRVMNRLAPVHVIINSFPRTSLTTQLMTVTGAQRAWIRVPALRQWRSKFKGPIVEGHTAYPGRAAAATVAVTRRPNGAATLEATGLARDREKTFDRQ